MLVSFLDAIKIIQTTRTHLQTNTQSLQQKSTKPKEIGTIIRDIHSLHSEDIKRKYKSFIF